MRITMQRRVRKNPSTVLPGFPGLRSLTMRLCSSRRRQNFLILLRAIFLFLYTTALLLSSSSALDCPLPSPPLQLSCPSGRAFFTPSSSSAFTREWPSTPCLWSHLPRFNTKPHPPPCQLQSNARWCYLPRPSAGSATTAAVGEISVLSSSSPPYKLIRLFPTTAPAAASAAFTGDAPAFLSTFIKKLWAASRYEVHEPVQQRSSYNRLHGRSALKVMPPMATPAKTAAASTAFLFNKRGGQGPLAAAGAPADVSTIRYITRHVVASPTRCAVPAASSAHSQVVLAASSNSSVFPTTSRWNAFIASTAAASRCGDWTSRPIIASTWTSPAAPEGPLSQQTAVRQQNSNTEALSSFALQQPYLQGRQGHRWTSHLSPKLSCRRCWQGGSLSSRLRQQRLQQLSFSSPFGCFTAAAASHRGRAPAGKQARMAVHTEAAAAKETAEAAAPHKEDPIDSSRRYISPVGLGSHLGGSATGGASSLKARTGVAAAAGAIDEPRSHQALQQHGDWQHSRRFTHTKQIATIGPASWTYEEIERLFLSGIDVFRLNLSHGLLHEKHQQLQHVRNVEKKYGHPIAVLADLPGPKLRLGSFEGDDVIDLPTGATFIIDSASAVLGNQQRVALPQNEEILQILRTGDVLLLDDGKLKLQVVRQLSCSNETYQQLLQQQRQYGQSQELQQQHSHAGSDEQQQQSQKSPLLTSSSFPDRIVGVECTVLVGGSLSGKKGVNIPSATLPISALSARDRELARLVAGWGVDWIALSFVQRAEDVRELRRELGAQAQLLAMNASGNSDSADTSKSSDRTLPTSVDTSSNTKIGHARKQPVPNNQEPSTPPLLTQKHQVSGTQQEREDQETEMEQQWRLLSSMKSYKESYSSFAPSHVRRGGEVAVIVKIEKPLALENIEEILEEADALMVARGDLGVELAEHAAWLPVLQKRLVKLCQEAGKPVVIATQMLDSMTHAPAPTRAELTDVANAVYDGADAVMLSGETAAGDAPARVARTQYEGIQAVENDPYFWRQQSTTRRLLVDEKAARAASRFSAEMHSSRGEFNSRAAGGGEGQVAEPGDTQAAASAEGAAGDLGRFTRGEGREDVGKEREKQVGEVSRKQQGSELFERNYVDYTRLDSNLCAGRTRLFPELRGRRLPWKRQRANPELPLGAHNAGDHTAVARRAAAAAAATPFYGDEPEVGSAYSSSRSRGSRTRDSRIRTGAHASADRGVSARRIEDCSETGDAGWVAAAAEQASRLSGATSIVVFEETGHIARHIAALRPAVPVVAVTPSAYVARELQLHWGVYPVIDTTIWKAETDVLGEAEGKGETAGIQGQSETKSGEERTSRTLGAACTDNGDTQTAVKPGRQAETWDNVLEDGTGKRVTREKNRPWRDLGVPFCTQISRAATLLVDEGLTGVDGDDKVVVVGGFYTRKEETAEERRQNEKATTFLPQISVSRIRAFL